MPDMCLIQPRRSPGRRLAVLSETLRWTTPTTLETTLMSTTAQVNHVMLGSDRDYGMLIISR